jgi:hypothetical protein
LVAASAWLALEEFFHWRKELGWNLIVLGPSSFLVLIASFHFCPRNQSAALLLVLSTCLFLGLGLRKGERRNRFVRNTAGVISFPTLGLLVAVRSSVTLGMPHPLDFLFLARRRLGDTGAYCWTSLLENIAGCSSS